MGISRNAALKTEGGSDKPRKGSARVSQSLCETSFSEALAVIRRGLIYPYRKYYKGRIRRIEIAGKQK